MVIFFFEFVGNPHHVFIQKTSINLYLVFPLQDCELLVMCLLKKFVLSFFMDVLGVRCFEGSSLVAARRLLVVASLVAKHGLQGAQDLVVAAPRLWSTGPVVAEHGLSCSMACAIFPDQGSHLCLLNWQAGSLPLSHQGSSLSCVIPFCTSSP